MTENFPDLERFVRAQDAAGTYASALAELRAGSKRGHWMWFVLPQVAGLGRSETAQRYAVSGLSEARAYLRHPVLGPRLRECAEALDALETERCGPGARVRGRGQAALVDDALRACRGDSVEADPFARVLEHFFEGRRDDATTGILGS